jgi:uncharacterized membrane protein
LIKYFDNNKLFLILRNLIIIIVFKFLSNLFESKPNGPQIAALFTSLLDVRISKTTLTKEIEEHENYPSLLSLSDVFNSYGVENLALQVMPKNFSEIPVPFVTQIAGKNSEFNFFTVVTKIGENHVNYYDPEKNRWDLIAKESLLKRWSGFVLLAEARANAGETDYDKKVAVERKILLFRYLISLCLPIVVVVAGLIDILQNGIHAFLPFIFSIFTLAGSITTVLLLWYELDEYNPILQQICSYGTKKINCTAVLQSKGAKIAGVSWSAIGLNYFAGMLLLMLFGGINDPGVLFVVAWLSTCAIFYTFFSVYYQWRIAKQWCALCLFIQLILVTQFSISIFEGWHHILPLNAISVLLTIRMVSAFFIPLIVNAVLLPALAKAKDVKRANRELGKLKHNRQIFDALLQKQKIVTESAEGLGIKLGNPNAEFKLIKVCNPYCGPCANAHAPIEDILHSNPNVQVQILFNATSSESDPRTPPVKHFFAIAQGSHETVLKEALNDWYTAKDKDYDKFAAKYPMNGELNRQDEKVIDMENWCKKVNITFTPTFFISMPGKQPGDVSAFYQLPEIYKIGDLKYFLSA